MVVYVETNFVMEVALLQEQYESCEKIIGLCEAEKAELVIPAFSLIEPYDTIIRNGKNRKQLSRDIESAHTQLARSKPFKEQIDTLQELTAFLVRSEQDEMQRLRATLERLLAVAEIIPLSATIVSAALAYTTFEKPQDALVYASVIEHLSAAAEGKKCFFNKNSKDFDDPDIEDALKSHDCKMLFGFDNGLEYLTSQVDS
jgi:PIN domain